MIVVLFFILNRVQMIFCAVELAVKNDSRVVLIISLRGGCNLIDQRSQTLSAPSCNKTTVTVIIDVLEFLERLANRDARLRISLNP